MRDTLISMLQELQHYKQQDRSILMEQLIVTRLNKSFAQYDKELQQGLSMLTRKHEKSILKRLNKI